MWSFPTVFLVTEILDRLSLLSFTFSVIAETVQ